MNSKSSGGGGGEGGGSSKDSSSNSESGSDSSQSDDLYRKEKRLMRVKAYETFKNPALPKNASEARGVRNQLYSNITKLAKGDEAPVFKWIDRCHREDDVSKLKDSGKYALWVIGCWSKRKVLAFPWISNPCRRKPRKRVASQKVGCILSWHVLAKYKPRQGHLFDSAPFVVLENLGQRCESVGELQD